MRIFYSRAHPRLRGRDYSVAGAYFATAITHQRRPALGMLARGGVVLTRPGEVVRRYLGLVADQFPGVTVDTFAVMPDHVHAIIVLSPARCRRVGLSQVVGWVKQRASREINENEPGRFVPLWQRSFHDVIIRDEVALESVRRYVIANPMVAWNGARKRWYGGARGGS